jgi:hypothetical protein
LSNISDYDVTVNKSAELAGQDCEVSLGIHNIKSVRTDEGARARARSRRRTRAKMNFRLCFATTG